MKILSSIAFAILCAGSSPSATEEETEPTAAEIDRSIMRVLDAAIDTYKKKEWLGKRCHGKHVVQSELAARAAAISEERAIRANNLAENTALSPEQREKDRHSAIKILIEAAGFWLLAWECQPKSTQYLDLAEKPLNTARNLLTVEDPKAFDDVERSPNFDEVGSWTLEPRQFDALKQIRHLERTLAEFRRSAAREPPPTPRSEDRPAITDRVSLRAEVGYGSGRLSRSPSATSGIYYDDKGFRSHRGAYFSTSVMMRLPATTGLVNVLAGPYYTYWRGAERSAVPETSSANVHEFGARIELSASVARKAIPYFTLHPALEFGLQYVDFDRWHYTEIPGTVGPEYRLDPNSTDMAGGTLGMAFGACFLYSSLCGTFRVHAVPMAWKNAIPTLRGGIAVDVVRLAHAIMKLR